VAKRTTADGRFLTKMDSVTEWVRDGILRGTLRPGTQLLQQDIARELHLSPTPVREAFAVLEAQGLVERRPHRGVVVADAQRDLDVVYELRSFLEVMAARRAAEAPTQDGVNELQDALDEGRRAMAVPDLQRFRRAGMRFHAALARTTSSPTLVECMETVLTRSFRNVPMNKARMVESDRAHTQMLNAIQRRDPHAAAAAATRHITAFTKAAALAQQRAAAGRALAKRVAAKAAKRRRSG
jgi:DNA-binding GntR family transcriptional regulator